MATMATFSPDPSDPAASGAAVTYYTVDNFRPENSMGYLLRCIMGVIA